MTIDAEINDKSLQTMGKSMTINAKINYKRSSQKLDWRKNQLQMAIDFKINPYELQSLQTWVVSTPCQKIL